GLQQHRIEASTSGKQGGIESQGHHHDVDQQREAEPGELADQELGPAERLRQKRIERTPLDLLADEAYTDKDGDHGSEYVHRRQPQVLDDLLVLANRQLAQEEPAQSHQDREENEVVEHALAHGFAESI